MGRPRVTVSDAGSVERSSSSEGEAAGDDASDVAAAAAGDVRAFERVYRRHVARIHSTAVRMLGAEEADDATQDVFVRAWQRLAQFRGESAFGTWLFRLAVNVMLSRREVVAIRHKRHVDDAALVESLSSAEASPELGLDFQAAIARLPPGMRQIFVLHDIEGYKHDEIAGMLGIAQGTSKSQLHRVRMILRRYLGA
ncbi:MAG TPA: sigma-70 family RNA polymerase sigma factor [Gemmatimonadaceae bacterium]|nr:sigma-70 family RNA polymerase sigma factor [Gemmatimonadaceae bacterium]